MSAGRMLHSQYRAAVCGPPGEDDGLRGRFEDYLDFVDEVTTSCVAAYQPAWTRLGHQTSASYIRIGVVHALITFTASPTATPLCVLQKRWGGGVSSGFCYLGCPCVDVMPECEVVV